MKLKYVIGKVIGVNHRQPDGSTVEREVIQFNFGMSESASFFNDEDDALAEAARRSHSDGFSEYVVFKAYKAVRAQQPIETARVTRVYL